MELRVLGPLEVVADGRSVRLGGTKQRTLLAVLALNANRVVSTDRLVDALWGDHAPDGAAHTLQVYVSELRKALGAAGSTSRDGPIVTQTPGYLLRVAPDDVDLLRFERIVGEARRASATGDVERAASLYEQALGLWRGSPFTDLADDASAAPEIARIEDLRLSVLEDRIEADLVLGRHGDVVSELHALVTEHPLRERLRAHLMLALYRSGRQAEALDAAREGRRLFAEELGLDLSPELLRLERSVLEHDPELELAAPQPRRPQGPGPGRGRARIAAVLLGVVAAIAATAVLILSRDTDPQAVVGPVEPNSVVRIDPDTARIVAVIPTAGVGPTAAEWLAGSVWVANTASKTVIRIDPKTDRVVQTIPADGAPTDLTAADGLLWVLNGFDGMLLAIDPRTNAVVAAIDVPVGSGQIDASAGAVWITNPLHASLTRVDPRSEQIVATVELGEPGSVRPRALAATADGVWVGDPSSPVLWHVDAATDRMVASPGLRGSATAIAVGGGAIWVVSRSEDLVSRVDPVTGRSVAVAVGDGPTGVEFGDGVVWVAGGVDGIVYAIDGAGVEVIEAIDVGATVVAVVLGDRDLWVTVPA